MVMVIIVIFHYEVVKMLLARAKNLIKTAGRQRKALFKAGLGFLFGHVMDP